LEQDPTVEPMVVDTSPQILGSPTHREDENEGEGDDDDDHKGENEDRGNWQKIRENVPPPSLFPKDLTATRRPTWKMT
jgi:hypothetical protein